jgi:hypothetical protein
LISVKRYSSTAKSILATGELVSSCLSSFSSLLALLPSYTWIKQCQQNDDIKELKGMMKVAMKDMKDMKEMVAQRPKEASKTAGEGLP